MPTYACSAAAAGRLTRAQKVEIVQRITAIHHVETGAPRYFVQVIFYNIAPGSHYIGGQSASQVNPQRAYGSFEKSHF
jgi:phenylpyruvate tautomerase PptA (4-oxalocrotonate tautomerase family)